MIHLDWLTFLGTWSTERCGFVLNSGEIVELPNTHSDPEYSFSISQEDAQPYLGNIKAIWHTHCTKDYNLSMEDYENFLEHPDFHHLIISHAGVAEYGVSNHRVVNLQRRVFNA